MSKIDYRPVVTWAEDRALGSHKASEEDTSVSKLVGRLMEREMRQSDRCWRAYEGIKRIRPIAGFDASKRSSRSEVYDRCQ